jgi:hypothetical protein
MAEIITFRRKRMSPDYPTFIKVADGKTFECVDVDALSSRQRKAFFERQRLKATLPLNLHFRRHSE